MTPTGDICPLVWVSDGRGDAGRLRRLAVLAVRGGASAVQVREPDLTEAQLAALCRELRPELRALGALLLVNGPVAVARAHGDGLQATARNRPWRELRARLGPGQMLVASVHSAAELAEAAAVGADAAVLAPVLPTASKPGAPALGLAQAQALTAGSPLPVLWLGGIDAGAARTIAALPGPGRPVGIAVLSAIAGAADPEAAARELRGIVAALGRCHTAGP